jgi:cytochrome c
MVYDPEYDATAEVNKFDVWTTHEDGMLGLALDSDFEQNNWLYLFYSPNIETSINRLSRFKWTGNSVDQTTEQIILEVPVDRNECCHSAGSLEFGPQGNLFLSIGDNTNPFDSEGFAPIDDSKATGNWDARRSSSNTNDLRGKILRIKVEEDGSYTTPADNLFPDGAAGRPEIYVMGCRNPFRISVDQRSGVLYWGDVGPDAGKDSTAFGPRGHCEVNFAPSAGYYGWPLFVADNKAYNRRDFTTDSGGAAFDPAKPINESRYNTGAKELPPARPAMIFYPYAASEEFPLLGEGGRNPMAGPVYHAADYRDSPAKLPEYYDGKFFFYEWMRDWVMAATLDETGKVVEFERFLPDQEFRHPMDMLIAPDGSMYVLEYGPLWFKENKDARILRIRYNKENRAPIPAMEVVNRIGAAPFKLQANIGSSEDYDGDEFTATWSLNGTKIGTGTELDYTVELAGVMTLTLQLDDGAGGLASEDQEIIVGNSLPRLAIKLEGNSSFYFDREGFDYSIELEDAEDGSLNAGIDPAAVTVSLDYVEGEDLIEVEYGHQTATEETQFLLGKKLIAKSDCGSCHQLKATNIGPAYLDVAQKYRSQPDAVAYLSRKIINGGGGVWGEQAMAAHPQLTPNEANQMANYILGLAGPPGSGTNSLPLAGRQKLVKHRAGTPGRYYFQASYTDKGGAGALPRLTARQSVVLRSPIIAAPAYEEGQGVEADRIRGKQNPTSDESVEVLLGSHNGWVTYGDIDLAGISQIEALVLLMPDVTSGGTIEVVLGNPETGKLVGSASIKQEKDRAAYHKLSIELAGDQLKKGTQPIYFRFLADGGEREAVMGAVVSFSFKQGGKMSR